MQRGKQPLQNTTNVEAESLVKSERELEGSDMPYVKG